MSTIEKAASRLAARDRSKPDTVRSLEPPAQPSRRIRSRPGGETPDLRGNAFVPSRFCDIDLDSLRERGFLTPDSGRSQLAQEMRRIKRPLLLNIRKAQVTAGEADADGAEADDRLPANLIMVTSALPGEGKTFTAINLAISMAAEVDRRVLLVDADNARGDVCRQLGITGGRGLADLLVESGHLFEDAVLTSNVERLSILPAGSPTDRVDELFASDMMGVVLRDLAEADPGRVVIFDASPLLVTTEAAVLARRMGQTVLIVEAGQTPQSAVAHALDQLEGCQDVSLVLNKTAARDAGGYGYGYGYGYGTDAVTARTGEQAQQG